MPSPKWPATPSRAIHLTRRKVIPHERFVGIYDIAKNIRMKSRFDTIRKEDDWLPCCSGGFEGMNLLDQRAFKSAKGVFAFLLSSQLLLLFFC